MPRLIETLLLALALFAAGGVFTIAASTLSRRRCRSTHATRLHAELAGWLACEGALFEEAAAGDDALLRRVRSRVPARLRLAYETAEAPQREAEKLSQRG